MNIFMKEQAMRLLIDTNAADSCDQRRLFSKATDLCQSRLPYVPSSQSSLQAYQETKTLKFLLKIKQHAETIRPGSFDMAKLSIVNIKLSLR